MLFPKLLFVPLLFFKLNIRSSCDFPLSSWYYNVNYFVNLLFAITKVDWIHERGLYMITDYLTKAGTAHAKGRLWSFISLQEVGPENRHILNRKTEWKSRRKWPWFTFPTEWSRVTRTQPKLNTESLISNLLYSSDWWTYLPYILLSTPATWPLLLSYTPHLVKRHYWFCPDIFWICPLLLTHRATTIECNYCYAFASVPKGPLTYCSASILAT